MKVTLEGKFFVRQTEEDDIKSEFSVPMSSNEPEDSAKTFNGIKNFLEELDYVCSKESAAKKLNIIKITITELSSSSSYKECFSYAFDHEKSFPDELNIKSYEHINSSNPRVKIHYNRDTSLTIDEEMFYSIMYNPIIKNGDYNKTHQVHFLEYTIHADFYYKGIVDHKKRHIIPKMTFVGCIFAEKFSFSLYNQISPPIEFQMSLWKCTFKKGLETSTSSGNFIISKCKFEQEGSLIIDGHRSGGLNINNISCENMVNIKSSNLDYLHLVDSQFRNGVNLYRNSFRNIINLTSSDFNDKLVIHDTNFLLSNNKESSNEEYPFYWKKSSESSNYKVIYKNFIKSSSSGSLSEFKASCTIIKNSLNKNQNYIEAAQFYALELHLHFRHLLHELCKSDSILKLPNFIDKLIQKPPLTFIKNIFSNPVTFGDFVLNLINRAASGYYQNILQAIIVLLGILFGYALLEYMLTSTKILQSILSVISPLYSLKQKLKEWQHLRIIITQLFAGYTIWHIIQTARFKFRK